MKTLFTLIIATLISSGISAQKRTLDIGSFTEVSFGTSGTIYLSQGDDEKVVIDCSDDVFEEIEIEVRGDRLKISTESSWGWNSHRKSELDIYITMKEIEGLSVSGSGSIYGEDQLVTDDLRLSVSGSGSMDLYLNSAELEMRISGSGSIKLDGQADRTEIGISGSGRLKADDMEVKIFRARISGSGSCYITATEEIDANISGSGSIYYSGNPDRVVSSSSGSGKIRKN